MVYLGKIPLLFFVGFYCTKQSLPQSDHASLIKRNWLMIQLVPAQERKFVATIIMDRRGRSSSEKRNSSKKAKSLSDVKKTAKWREPLQ